MNNVNKTLVIGYIAKEFVMRKTSNDNAVVNMTVVTKEYIGKGKDHHTEWHNVVLWGQSAEYASKYAAKGDLVYIEGPNRAKDYEDKDGNKKRSHEIQCNDFKILKKKEDRSYSDGAADDRQETSSSNDNADDRQETSSSNDNADDRQETSSSNDNADGKYPSYEEEVPF